jgi:tetratricopeptide (TPR) repeat protein
VNTPSSFTALRREVVAVIEAGRVADQQVDRPVARSNYERALRMLARDEAEFAPLLIRRIARSYIEDGIFDAALDCLAAAQHLSRALGDTAGVAHALNQMAGANVQRGDLESAEALYQKAHGLAEAANDAPLEAMVVHNLGVVAGIRSSLDGIASPVAAEQLAGSPLVGSILWDVG